MYDGTKPDRAFFELTITCRALFLIFKDSGEVDAGTADVLVDGEFRFTADPHVNNCRTSVMRARISGEGNGSTYRENPDER